MWENEEENQVHSFIGWNNAIFKDKISADMNCQRMWNILLHNSDSLLGKRLLERVSIYSDIKRSEMEKMFANTLNYEFIDGG